MVSFVGAFLKSETRKERISNIRNQGIGSAVYGLGALFTGATAATADGQGPAVIATAASVVLAVRALDLGVAWVRNKTGGFEFSGGHKYQNSMVRSLGATGVGELREMLSNDR